MKREKRVVQKIRELPSREYLNEILSYTPTTGDITWKARTEDKFQDYARYRYWNSRFSGKVAGCFERHHKFRHRVHRTIRIDGVLYLQHRVIYNMLGIEVPRGYDIDHIDRDPWNNRIDNLRLLTRKENCANSGNRRSNTSGHKGVSWDKRMSKWVVQTRVLGDGVRFLGYYDDIPSAVARYEDALREAGLYEISNNQIAEDESGQS